MSNLLRSYGLCALVVLAIACDTGEPAPDENAVLASVTDLVIVPGYESLAQETHDLRMALDNLCALPSETAMSTAQQAWKDARAPWMQSTATWFGPILDRRSLGIMDWPQVQPERIEAMLESNPATTEDDVRNRLASTQRGPGTIEYLLFTSDAVNVLSGPSSTRCDYLTALGRVVEIEAAAVAEAWTSGADGGTAYKDFFTGRSSSSLFTRQAMGELVRTQVFLIRTLVDMRLASAMGLREGGPDLSALPGGDGQNALSDLRNEILGMRDVYFGLDRDDSFGISDLVRDLSV